MSRSVSRLPTSCSSRSGLSTTSRTTTRGRLRWRTSRRRPCSVDLLMNVDQRVWPSNELVADRSQGVQLATVQALAHYWATNYDWRNAEAKLNALPQFTTEIDGAEIHFIHVRSPHENA